MTSVQSGGIGDKSFNLARNCEVSNRNESVFLTKGVKIFSSNTDMGDMIESVDANIGLPGGLCLSCLCIFGRT